MHTVWYRFTRRTGLFSEQHGEGGVFLDTALPFGLRSAPKIFSAVADALLWAMACNGVQLALHYLDNFLFAGPKDSAQCQQAVKTALATCRELGVPVAPEKLEGPATNITFLGIQFGTQTMQLSLPPEKLQRISQELARWSRSARGYRTKRDLLSLIGLLQHAAFVVRPGRAGA